MSAQTALLRGRQAAEALMRDACTVTRPGPSTTDDLTGAVTSSPSTQYSGKCKVQQGAGGRRMDVGEVTQVMLGLRVDLPVVGSQTVAVGDVVTITAVGSTSDPALLNRTFRVKDLLLKSYSTARRLGCEEVT